MGGPTDVVAEAVEANRLKEQLLGQHARAFSRGAAAVLEALRDGRTLHCAGEGSFGALAEYLAQVFFRAGLAGRALVAPGDDPDGALRAVDAFVHAGDVLLVLGHDARPGLERALVRARARGAVVIVVAGEPLAAAVGAACDVALPVPSGRPLVTAEVAVALGHVLFGLVEDGVSGLASAASGPAGPAPAPPLPAPPLAATLPTPRAPARPASAPRSAPPSAPPLPVPAVARGRAPAAVREAPRFDMFEPSGLAPSDLGSDAGSAEGALASHGASSGVGSSAGAPTPPRARPSEMGVIDHDPLEVDDLDEDDGDDASLLSEAVEGTVAPPTDPRATRRREAPSLVRFRCGGCEEPIVVEGRYAGRRGQCPHCKAEFLIPRPAPADSTATQRATVLTPAQVTADARARAQPQPTPRATPAVPTPRAPAAPAPAAPRRDERSASSPAATAPAASSPSQAASERRRAVRIAVKDALLRWAKDDYPSPAGYHEPHALEDLSLTGLRFVGRAKDYEVGDVLCFSLDFPAFPEPVRIKGEVRRVTRLKNGSGWGAGVRFVQYVGDAEQRLRRLLENVQLRGVRRR